MPSKCKPGSTQTTIPQLSGTLTHHVVLLKECVVKVVAETVSIQRFEGTTLDAATAAMGG